MQMTDPLHVSKVMQHHLMQSMSDFCNSLCKHWIVMILVQNQACMNELASIRNPYDQSQLQLTPGPMQQCQTMMIRKTASMTKTLKMMIFEKCLQSIIKKTHRMVEALEAEAVAEAEAEVEAEAEAEIAVLTVIAEAAPPLQQRLTI